MSANETVSDQEQVVPDSVIPHGDLPPLRYRDLPPPVPLRRMLGPSIILAGLALGSGEFVLWPFITFRSGFIFFWACLLGVTTQYFINLEITRWTLATGESAITGFCRLNRHFAWVFLACNIIPWMIPAWATGSAQLVSWLIWPEAAAAGESPYLIELSICGLVLCGLVLTAGPVIYETVERVQVVLVSTVLVLVVVLAALVVRGDAVVAMLAGAASVGQIPPLEHGMSAAMLLGALAFAGAGGTLNLGQSNYVKDKGYGMGSYIGRITSPITGQPEPVSEIGYHFPETPENLSRWRRWWRAACIEHFFSFYLTCVVCLVLLSLISYSVFYQPDGTLIPGTEGFTDNLFFIWAEAEQIGERVSGLGRLLFLIMGVAVLMTTEFGVLDVTARISTDTVKVNFLRENSRWTESRLYYLFLWGTILLGAVILLSDQNRIGALPLFKLSAALNGGVMFLYCILLLYLNRFRLPRAIRATWWQAAVLVWAVLFFGAFAGLMIWEKVRTWFGEIW